jgi:hypothetical protein
LAERCKAARAGGKDRVWIRETYVGERTFEDEKSRYEVLLDAKATGAEATSGRERAETEETAMTNSHDPGEPEYDKDFLRDHDMGIKLGAELAAKVENLLRRRKRVEASDLGTIIGPAISVLLMHTYTRIEALAGKRHPREAGDWLTACLEIVSQVLREMGCPVRIDFVVAQVTRAKAKRRRRRE